MNVNGSSYYQYGSNTGISGLSGTNFAALIKAQYQAELQPTVRLKQQNQTEQQRVTGLNQMSGLLDKLQKAIAKLASLSTTGTGNSLNAMKASLTGGSTDPTKLLKVTAGSKAIAGNYILKILQKASSHRISSAGQASATSALGQAGIFTLKTAGKTGADIAISTGMSLTDIASEINKKTAETGVSASILKISASEHRLVLSAVGTNKPIQIIQKSGSNIPQTIGLLNGSGTPANQLQAATPAQLELNGITVTRDSNRIDDLIDGVTLDILKQAPAESLTLKIEPDSNAIEKAMKEFVEAYNKYRDFALAQQAVGPNGAVSPIAQLFGSSVLKNVNGNLYQTLTNVVKHDGKDYSLRNFGLKFDKQNKLELDSSKLSVALKDNLEAVKSFFAARNTSSNPDFRLTKHTDRYAAQDFNLSVTMAGGKITAASLNGNSGDIEIDGNQIKGKAGSVFEGLAFTYVGSSSASTKISFSQGIADRLKNELAKWTDSTTGILSREIKNGNKVIQNRQSDIKEIENRAAQRREQLAARYARIEQQIARSNLLVRQMTAITDAANAKR